jgi:hypothetical protein
MVRRDDVGTAALIDRTRRATAAFYELSLEPALAAEALGRSPDVDGNGLLSWAVTAAEVRALVDLSGGADDLLVWDELLAEHSARDLFISLFWRTGPARGE